MDIQPFFTEEEKKQFFSKYKQLLRHLYSFLKKEDLSKMKELMKQEHTNVCNCFAPQGKCKRCR